MSGRTAHVIVIGAGLAGLALARDLTRANVRVTVLDAARDFGGLASSLTLAGTPVERFYHFVCRDDRDLIDLVRECGLGRSLRWRHAQTSFFYDGRAYRFGAPLDLLRFSPIPISARVRFGAHVAASRYAREWRDLDRVTAKAWIVKHVGERAYDVIWRPLLQVKFGDDHEQISAAWMWHRIHRVAASRANPLARAVFGYLEGGSFELVDRLRRELDDAPTAELRLGQRVRQILVEGGGARGVALDGASIAADAVVSTVPLPVLDRLLPGRAEPYFARARQIRYIGVVCALLALDHPFSDAFWCNIHDARVAFNGVIEQTNLNAELRAAGHHLLYVPFYLPTTHPRYAASDEALLEEYVPMLQVVNPRFRRGWIRHFVVSRAPHAQAICNVGFADLIPGHRTPIARLYVTDSAQFYPEDRTLSAAIRQGRTVGKLLLEDLRWRS